MSKIKYSKEIVSLEESVIAFRRKMVDMIRQKSENIHHPISQIDALFFISEKGKLLMKDISGYLKITSPSATSIVNSMEKKKWIKRISDKKDRRITMISLTPKAKNILRHFHDVRLEMLDKMFEKLNLEEKKQFTKIINKIIKD